MGKELIELGLSQRTRTPLPAEPREEKTTGQGGEERAFVPAKNAGTQDDGSEPARERVAAGDGRAAQYAALVDALLKTLAEMTVEEDYRRTPSFQSQVTRWREKLGGEPAVERVASVAAECLEACETYFRGLREHRGSREKEIQEVIAVLRKALAELAGDAGGFQSGLLQSSERFHRMAELDDIRELKKQVVREAQALKVVVDEKRKRDEALCAQLEKRVEALQSRLHRAVEESLLDPLTQVTNRRGFDRTIERWALSHAETKTTFALGMLDVDNFKQVNDTHGHPVGDLVLKTLGQKLNASVRTTDFVARYGGEEFAVLLGEMDMEAAEAKLARVVEEIAAAKFHYTRGNEPELLAFTVSCGVAEYSRGESVADLIARADEALYDAKRNGKNRVVVAKKSFVSSLFDRFGGAKSKD
ncbi:MAG: GGDEF domain-containing protein [Acidobacteria bacterium]|nr:GGDEF domain-containing protein [Acidobacteriota bacterium]